MKAIKFMITGALLIQLGPVMHILDVSFSGFHLICWLIGIPLFLAGLVMPKEEVKAPARSENLPQKECPKCGKSHDFDYPKCPYCGHDYQAKQVN